MVLILSHFSVKKKGLACRVWNDQLLRTDDQHVALDPSIDIIYWTNDYTPMQRLAEAGGKIHSSNTDWCYYVIRRDRRSGDIMDRTRRYCASEYIYEHWDPRNCEAKSTLPQPGKPQQIRIGRWEQIKRAVLTNYLTRTSPR